MTVALAIACVLVTGNCSPVTAQVAIGGDGTVTPGALLDLSQATDAGGLLLPQIVSADTATAVLKKPGMLVYNKTDGKIYAYNGTAWSAGGGSGGGGGNEPEPTPSPTSCSGSVMGVSGNLYPIGSYPYVQSDLKNLCWTLSNLKEAGAAATNYGGKTEDRGYYYKCAAAHPSGSLDICASSLGSAWRLPPEDTWKLLRGAFYDLTINDRNSWMTAPSGLAGGIGCYQCAWAGWDSTNMWVVGGVTGNLIYYTEGSGDSVTWTSGAVAYEYISVRCVRDV
jgi:hypothetical protein